MTDETPEQVTATVTENFGDCCAAGRAHLHRIAELIEQLADMPARLARIETNQETEMSGLTDLQGAITAMQAEWTTFLADVTAALGNEDSDAAVEAASQLVATQTAAMVAADPANAPAAPPAG